MKVKQLIEELQKHDPELNVCVFSDLGAMLVDRVQLLRGNFEDPNNVKLIHKEINAKFLALNNYADFDLEHETYIHEE